MMSLFNRARSDLFRAAAPLTKTFAFLAVTLSAFSRPAPAPGPHPLASMPMYFESNAGQTDPEVQFISRGPRYALFLGKSEAVLSLRTKRAGDQTIRMRLLDASPSTVEGIDRLPGAVNYFVGNQPASWHGGVKVYGKVKYSQVYPGIDLLYYGNQQQLEYDFIVQPGGEPERIVLEFEGATGLEVDSCGELRARVRDGDVRWLKPVAYQHVDGSRHEVTCDYALTGKQVKFRVGSYNPNLPLVIDPILAYSTFLGGADLDAANTVAVDRNGNLYVAGETLSLNFPVFRPIRTNSAGNTDVFVTKLSPSGTSLVYSTYLGGGGNDAVRGIAVDRNGVAYITGDTESLNFPTRNAFQAALDGDADAFITKISAAGTNLVYSSYLGGQDYDSANGIAVNDNGVAFIAGETYSGQSFQKKNPVQNNPGGFLDAFVARFDTTASGSASLNWSSPWGGSDDERALSVGLDSDTNVVVVGEVLSLDLVNADFPTRNAYQSRYGGGGSDCFILKVNAWVPNAPVVGFSTYLGGEAEDVANDVALDANDHIVLVGRTTSTEFPIADAAQAQLGSPFGATPDAFITRLQRNGATVLYSSYLGGEVIDEATSVSLDNDGYIYVGGWTTSLNFPVTVGADQPLYGGGGADGFVTKLRAEVIGSNALVYSTFIGGDDIDMIMGIDTDPAGNFYVAGQTSSSNFTTTAGMPQTTYRGGYSDAFAAKYLALPDLGVTVVTSVDPIPLNSTFTYTVQVYNNGRTTFTGVGLSNALSPYVRFISATSTRGGCSHSGGVVTCTFGQLTNNARVTVTITGRADVAGLATNSARLFAAELEQNSGNNVAVVENAIKGSTDLVVTQSSTPDPVLVTSNLVHTITLRNAGAVSPATLVNLLHFFPPTGGSFTYGSSQGSCNFDGASLFCDIGTINPGATAIILITNRPANIGAFTNEVQASLHEIDPVPGNNSSSSPFSVVGFTDLTITNRGPAGPVVSSNLTYTVTVSNRGPTTAQSVTITEPFSPSFVFVGASATQGSCSAAGGTITCNLGNLGSNSSATATLTLRPVVSGTLELTATVASPTADPDTQNNASTVRTTVDASADLAIRLTATPTNISVTSNITYTVSVTNHGAAAASNVTITDVLPNQLSFVRYSTNTANCSVNGQVVSCNVGNLASGAGTRVTLIIRAAFDGSIVNTVTASSDLQDPAPANNTASATVNITPASDLMISQYIWPEPLTDDNRTTYNVTVINGGPSTVTGVSFTNRIPSAVGFLSFTANNAACNMSSSNVNFTTITCNGGTMTNGERASVVIRVRPNSAGLYTNLVTTRATSPVDLNLANNTDTSVLRVFSGASLALLGRTNEVVLGWPTNRGPMRLFSTPDLAIPQWTRVTNASSLFLDYNVLTQDISGVNLFYRLERQ